MPGLGNAYLLVTLDDPSFPAPIVSMQACSGRTPRNWR
nr:DUF736 domain-containing protein [Agrobacterium tumefaciens]